MVATRRGTRVGSPPKKVNDEISESTVPTPSTRRTRNRSLMEEKHSQSEPDGDSRSDADKDNITAPSLPASPPKRETRRSTRHLNDQKQPDSTHEADVSESESCSSVASGVKAIPRTRRRTITKEKPQTPQKDDISDAESCSSAVSALCSQRATRSLRKRVKTPAACNPATNDDGDLSDAGSYSSVVSLSKVLDTRRITRSRRTPAMSTAKLDPSDPDSCSSSVSGLQGSVVRRSARNQKEKPTKPIPLSLEETTDTPSTPVSKRRRDLQSRTKAEPGKESLDSDECLSGPSTSPWRSRRLQAKSITVGESGSEAVHVDVCSFQDSPRTLRGKGSLCLSRTDSDSSNRAVPVTRARSKASVACDDTTGQEEKECKELEPTPLKCESAPVEEDLEEPVDATVDAQECTMIEATAADITLTLDQDESAESSLHGVEILETQSMPEADAPISNIAVTEIAEAGPEKAVEEMAAAVAKDGDVAMENNEPEFVKQNLAVKTTNSDAAVADPAHVPTAVEGNVEVVCEKGVVVTCDADESVRAIVDETSILLNDAVNAELLSQTSDDLTTTEKASIGSAPRKEMISLLDSSADEDSPDEGLSADEEEAQGSQEAVGGISDDDDVRCPDEGQQLVEAQSSGLFVIDTRPGLREDEKYYVDGEQGEDEEEDEDFVDEEEDDDDEDSQALFAAKRPLMQLSTSIDTGLKLKDLGGLYIGFDGKTKNVSGGLNALKGENKVDELMKKSVIVPGFEKKDAIPPLKESKHAAKLKRKAEREKTTGDGWFNMKAPELTEELKNDLKALKMRSAMDPKRFYKKNDREGFPKYFQVGKVVDSPVDFYSSRIPKKERKRTIVEELLADAEFRSNNKRKYQEIMTEKAAQMAGKIKKHKFHKKKTNK